MHVHRIEVHYPPDQAQEPIIELFDRLLGALRMNGQICGTQWPMYEASPGFWTWNSILYSTTAAMHAGSCQTSLGTSPMR